LGNDVSQENPGGKSPGNPSFHHFDPASHGQMTWTKRSDGKNLETGVMLLTPGHSTLIARTSECGLLLTETVHNHISQKGG